MKHEGTRSPLARAIGLGSAKSGAEQWWAERVSAVALVPLSVWFVGSIIAHSGSDHATFTSWLSAPMPMILMVLLVIAVFHHAALGLQVIVEDYVHSTIKFALIVAVRLGCFASAVAGVLAVLRIGFSG